MVDSRAAPKSGERWRRRIRAEAVAYPAGLRPSGSSSARPRRPREGADLVALAPSGRASVLVGFASGVALAVMLVAGECSGCVSDPTNMPWYALFGAAGARIGAGLGSPCIKGSLGRLPRGPTR